jgi:sulfofructose kinase
MRTIVCLGHAALDRIYSVPHMPVGSTKVRATAYSEVGGGMASNGACAIARLADPAQFRVEFWGRTGDDSAGAIIHADLARYGVDVTHLRSYEGCMSSQSAVMVDPAGERMVVNYRGDVPTEDVAWLPFERIANAAAILTDVRWLEGARKLLIAARDARVPAVLDADLGDVPFVRELVPLAEHAVFSEPGLANWAGHNDEEAALRAAADAGARVAAVTRGGNGTWVLFDGTLHHVPALPIDVVDTLGAGDVFHGAYTLGIAEGMTVLDATRFASAAAAIKCSRHGGRTGSPMRGEVEALIAGLSTSAPNTPPDRSPRR